MEFELTDDDGSVTSAMDSSLVIIQAQVSANNQDFCPISSRSNSILCHSFHPSNVYPSCCPLSTSLGKIHFNFILRVYVALRTSLPA